MRRHAFRVLLILALTLPAVALLPAPAAAALCTTTLSTGADIQAAIDVASSGAVICLNPGTYTPSATINVNQSVTIQGPQAGIDPRPSFGSTRNPADATTEAIVQGANFALFNIAAHNVEINGLTIESSITSSSLNIVQDNDTSFISQGAKVLYNIIYNTNYPGGAMNEAVKIRVGTDALIAYNYIYNIPSPGDGINFDSVTNGVIEHNELRNQGSDNAAIYVYGSTGTQIVGNLVYDITKNDGIKLGDKGGSDAAKVGGSILNNAVHHTAQDGITVYMSGVLVEGNDVSNSTSENGAIYAAWALSNITIINNCIHNNTLNPVKLGNPAGILIGTAVNAASVTISNNNIENNTPNGVTNKAATTLNANDNWWGAVSGPFHPTSNPGGTGGTVSDGVIFAPWLPTPAAGTPCSPPPPDNAGPVTSNVVANPNPVAVNSLLTVTANVNDTTTGGSNIDSAMYTLSDDNGIVSTGSMSASDGGFDSPNESVNAPFSAPAVAGIYDLCVNGTDAAGNVGMPECIMLVVYDPQGGFVTGGGWIDSPAGAYRVPALVWDQGFETDTDGWLDSSNGWYGTITRVPSGTGVNSASGSYHAIAAGDADSAPFSRFDGYRNTWPGTWTAEIDVYLDPAWAAGTGFDYTVAANGSDGNHQRDYIFHVTKDTSTGKLLVAGSNNTNFAPREDLENINHYEVTTAGWYTLQHIFYDQNGALAVDLNLLDANGTVLFTETRYNAADTIPGEVGGNRYAWFTFINVQDGIAVDNHQLILPNAVTGKANFGFVSKYKKGATVPEGQTEFVFQAAGLNFHSTSYEWLVVNQGGSNAQFKGEGTINGAGSYKFMLWAGDGTGSNGEDTFRIKVWYEGNDEVVVYDNGTDQAIGGGNIVVHKGK